MYPQQEAEKHTMLSILLLLHGIFLIDTDPILKHPHGGCPIHRCMATPFKLPVDKVTFERASGVVLENPLSLLVILVVLADINV